LIISGSASILLSSANVCDAVSSRKAIFYGKIIHSKKKKRVLSLLSQEEVSEKRNVERLLLLALSLDPRKIKSNKYLFNFFEFFQRSAIRLRD
jgi:hypothetical protein